METPEHTEHLKSLEAKGLNYLEILGLALQFFLAKSGSVVVHARGKAKRITVTEIGTHTTPIGHFTLAQAFALAAQVLAGKDGTFTVRVGSDDFSVTISDA